MAGIGTRIKEKLKALIKKRDRIFKRDPKLKFVYGWYYKHSRVVPNRILFESFHGKTISDSPLAMLQELVKSYPAGQYEIYYSTNPDNLAEHRAFIEKNNLPVKLVSISDYAYVKVLATAQYLINNSSFPAYFIRKEEQNYLQTWHGTPLKTLGKEMRKGIESMYNVQHNFLQANYLMFPNMFTKTVIMRDYNLESLYTGKVAMCGYPRNSILLDEKQAEAVRERYGLQGKTVYAYMPTWRGTSNHSIQVKGYTAEVDEMMSYLDKQLTDDQILFVNFHPLLANLIQLSDYKHIRKFPPDIGNYEFLACADALMTDYSSVFFDYSITGKPILLYMYDYDQYMKDRGMYMDVKSLPFVQVYELEEMAHLLASEEILRADYSKSDYAKEFTKNDAPDIPAKLLQLVLTGKADLTLLDYSENTKPEHRVLHINRLKGGGDFTRLARFAKQDDIVLFERRDFNIARSSELYDTCNDQFDYVFISRTTPRTFLEEGLSVLGHKKTVQALEQRELKRSFPHLRIRMPYLENFFVAEEGCSLRSVESRSVPVTAACDGETLTITLSDPQKYHLKKLLIADPNTTIVFAREYDTPPTTIALDQALFTSISADFLLNKNYRLYGVFEDGTGQEPWLGAFADPAYSGVDASNLLKHLKDGMMPCPIYVLQEKPAAAEKETADEAAVEVSADGSALKEAAEETAAENILEADAVEDASKAASEDAAEGEEQQELAIVPVLYQKGMREGFLFQVRKPEDAINTHFRPLVQKYTSRGNRAVLRLTVPKAEHLEITDVILKYRSVVPMSYPLPYEIRETNGQYVLTVTIDFDAYEFREIYWDLCVCLNWHGREIVSQAHYKNKVLRVLFYLQNRQYYLKNGMLLYPYYTKGSNVAFLYRPASVYDKHSTVYKEIAATLVYALFGGILRKRQIWMVYEKFCSMAQDNGYYFFKYCMEELPEEEKKRIYYIMDKHAPDYAKVAQYGRQVVPFMSFRHMLYSLAVEVYVASDSRTHAYQWRGKPGLIMRKIRKKRIYFLQHGVTALKRDDQLFGKHGTSPMTFFATTSEFEQKIILDNFGYDESEVPVTGFTRWDVLEDHASDDAKTLLIMPTWRAWLEEVSDEAFLDSIYYERYASLINSARFAALLEENDVKAIFYIHPKFANYIRHFDVDSAHVQIIPFGQEPLNEIMMRSHAMITDYSSVCWDMYYQKKPVIFYQFDIDQYNEAHGSYIDMETELFGVRALDEDTLLDALAACIRSGFALPEKDLEEHPYYFSYVDDRNSQRTYDFLAQRFKKK